MTTAAADLASPLADALYTNTPLLALLPVYKSPKKTIFTRRPVPSDANYPMIVISPDISLTDADGISDFRPIQERDIVAYGLNDTSEKYRVIEQLGYMLRDQFHRQRDAITVSGWSVVGITARGPFPAPTDDDKTVARLVSLSIQLARAG